MRERHQRQTTCLDIGKGDTEQLPSNITSPSWDLLFSCSLPKSPEPLSELRLGTVLQTLVSMGHLGSWGSSWETTSGSTQDQTRPELPNRSVPKLLLLAVTLRNSSHPHSARSAAPVKEALGQSAKWTLGTTFGSLSVPPKRTRGSQQGLMNKTLSPCSSLEYSTSGRASVPGYPARRGSPAACPGTAETAGGGSGRAPLPQAGFPRPGLRSRREKGESEGAWGAGRGCPA